MGNRALRSLGNLYVRARKFWLVLAFLLPALVSCALEPLTGRRKLQLVPEATMNQMGAQVYQQVLSESKLSTDAAQAAMIRRIGERIAAVVDRKMAEEGRDRFEWEYKLVDSDQVNAFALPGGKVAFYTGILPVCQDENGVAVVMGHEAAHAYAQHGNDRVSREVVATTGLQAVELALSGNGDPKVNRQLLEALGVGAQVGYVLKFSRDDESSADHIGLVLMAEAGYDPRVAVEFWQRMDHLSGGQHPPEFLSTHPSHETRIERLQKLLPEAILIYQSYKK